jgi:hypothetical protein
LLNTCSPCVDKIKMTMANPPPIPPVAQPPFAHLASPAVTAASPQHLEQIGQARIRGKTIRRCASIANGSAWTIAIFGALSFLTGIGSIPAMVLGVGMCVLAHFEFQGAKGIRKLHPEAAWHLARNQLILGAALLLYAGVSLIMALSGPSELQKAVGNDPQLTQMLGNFTELERTGYIVFYGIVGFAAIVGCGGTALYYVRRKPHIERYLRETPPWIIELERAGMTVY